MLRSIIKKGNKTKTTRSKVLLVIDDIEKAGLINNEQSNQILKAVHKNYTVDNLLDTLTLMNIIKPIEPLNEDVEDFIQELGAVDAQSLADFVIDLRKDKKGLKDMTPVPVKQFFPAAYLAVIGGLILFAVILSPQIKSALDQVMGGASAGAGGFKMPFFGFLSYLISLFI